MCLLRYYLPVIGPAIDSADVSRTDDLRIGRALLQARPSKLSCGPRPGHVRIWPTEAQRVDASIERRRST